MRKPKAILVPLGYPDYPREIVDKFIEKSREMIGGLGIDLVTTDAVIKEGDVEKATKLIRETEFDFTIPLIVSWVEAPIAVAVLRDFFDKPILLWSHTTYQEGGKIITLGPIPAAGVIRETFEEMGARFKFIYGMPNSNKVREEIKSFANIARTLRALSKAKVGLFGYFAMGMYTGGFDHTKIRKLIGPEIVHIGQYYIIKRSEEIEEKKLESLINYAKANWDIMGDVDDKSLISVLRVYLALEELIEEYKLDALTVKCQYELSRVYGIAPCIPLSMLGDKVTSSCEGDMPLVISQLILHYLTDGAVATYGDVADILEDNSIIIAACGFAPLSIVQGRPKVGRHTALYEGLLNMSPYKEGEVTLARLASDDNGYKMHIATGKASTPPPFHEINCPPYAGMKVVLDGPVDSFMQNLMSQHYGVVYGDVRKELLEICRLLKIRPVEVK